MYDSLVPRDNNNSVSMPQCSGLWYVIDVTWSVSQWMIRKWPTSLVVVRTAPLSLSLSLSVSLSLSLNVSYVMKLAIPFRYYVIINYVTE